MRIIATLPAAFVLATLGLTRIDAQTATGLNAATCPAERPHAKTVEGPAVTCTAVMCIGQLICPSDAAGKAPLNGADCYYGPATACNTCQASKNLICLSDAELEKASQ